MKYPKIQTLWKRDVNNKYVIIEGEFSKAEFANIKKWLVTEKIDGTNIRVMFDGEKVTFGGRTDRAQLYAPLVTHLQETFTHAKLKAIYPDATDVVLFGEGYGAKIQKGGGLYRKDVSFILFDVVVEGTWLEHGPVSDISSKLGIDMVPCVGQFDTTEIERLVKNHPPSIIAEEFKIAEGIVARSYPLVLFRNGTPVMFKLKCEDYRKLKQFGKVECE